MINEVPDSITFGRYVVGNFSRVKDNSKVVDSFEIAFEYLKEKPPRNLKGYLEMVEKQLL